MANEMKSGIYEVSVTMNFDRTESITEGILIGDGGTAFVKLRPVDAAEVVHGRWDCHASMVRTPFALNHDCSICGGESSKTTNYCPNCGAKMDLEE